MKGEGEQTTTRAVPQTVTSAQRRGRNRGTRGARTAARKASSNDRGAGAPGSEDIYIMDIASKQWVQLTHDGGRNDFPSWASDGRHIVFQSNRSGSLQIWTMFADGTNQKQITASGANSEPDWSWK